ARSHPALHRPAAVAISARGRWMVRAPIAPTRSAGVRDVAAPQSRRCRRDLLDPRSTGDHANASADQGVAQLHHGLGSGHRANSEPVSRPTAILDAWRTQDPLRHLRRAVLVVREYPDP